MLIIRSLVLSTLQGLLATMTALSLTMVVGLIAFPIAVIAGVIWGGFASIELLKPTKNGMLVIRIANVCSIVIAAGLATLGKHWLDAAEKSAREGGGLLGGLGYLPIALSIMICLVSLLSLLAIWAIKPHENPTA